MKPTQFGIGGLFNVSCYDKDGNLKWEDTAKNGVTNVGLDSTLDVYFNATDTIGGVASAGWQWALGLIDDSGFVALAAADTHAIHGGWSEFTDYTISGDSDIRPEWASPVASGQTLENTALIDYLFTSAGTIHGLFIAGGSVAGVTPGATDADNKGSSNVTPLLWATAALSLGNQSVLLGDTLRSIYIINAQST